MAFIKFNERLKWFFLGFLLLALLAYPIIKMMYYNSIKASSNFRYTVAEITDECVSHRKMGRTINYAVNGRKFTDCVFSDEIKKLRIGNRIFVRVFLEDPSAYDLIYLVVPDSLHSPEMSWDSLPLTGAGVAR